jgi:hypothetical protein
VVQAATDGATGELVVLGVVAEVGLVAGVGVSVIVTVWVTTGEGGVVDPAEPAELPPPQPAMTALAATALRTKAVRGMITSRTLPSRC